MSAKSEPKTLDKIVERLSKRWHTGSMLFRSEVRAALDEAFDLGRAEMDKEWREWLEQWVNRRRTHDVIGATVSADDLLAALDAREKESR